MGKSEQLIRLYRDIFLDATDKFFRTHGYSPTIKETALALNLSPGALYRYGKEFTSDKWWELGVEKGRYHTWQQNTEPFSERQLIVPELDIWVIKLPSEVTQENGWDSPLVGEKVRDQVVKERLKLSQIIPMNPAEERIEVWLHDSPSIYSATAARNRPYGTRLDFYNLPTRHQPPGFTIDRKAKIITINPFALASEMLHHVDHVWADTQGLPVEFDPAWRSEMVDNSQKLRPGELNILPIGFVGHTPTEQERARATADIMAKQIGGTFHTDIFLDPLSPFPDGHQEANHVIHTAFQLALKYGSDQVYERFRQFAIRYRPPYFPLFDISLLANLDQLGRLKHHLNHQLYSYQPPLSLVGFINGAQQRLVSASSYDKTEASQRQVIDPNCLHVIRNANIDAISLWAQDVLEAHPQYEQLTAITRDMFELTIRVSFELKTGEFSEDTILKLKLFDQIMRTICSRSEAISSPKFVQGDLQTTYFSGQAQARVDQFWHRMKAYIGKLKSHAQTYEHDAVKWYKDYEHARHLNRLRILTLQESLTNQLIHSPFAVKGGASDRHYPTELSRLRQPEELEHELGLKNNAKSSDH